MGASCSAVRSVPPRKKQKQKKNPCVFPPFIFNRHLIDRSPVVETAVEIDFSRSDAGKIRREGGKQGDHGELVGEGRRRGLLAADLPPSPSVTKTTKKKKTSRRK